MISKIHIKNFQSHTDTELEFHPGVNTIVGSSDSGKSAIFRAIGWIMTNRPLGNAFCKWGTKKTQVDITVDKNTQIGRTKSKASNDYLFQGNKLLAGTEVPQDIQKVLKVDPAINIQPQIGAPFLLSNSPGEVASFFNDIAGLSDIDLSIKNLKSWQAMHTRAIKRLDLDIEKQQTRVEEMEYLEQAELDITRLEDKEVRLQGLDKKQKGLKTAIHKYTRCKESLEQISAKAGALDQIKKLTLNAKTLSSLRSKISKVEKIIQNYHRSNEQLVAVKNKANAAGSLTAIRKNLDKLNTTSQQMKALKINIKNWTTVNTSFKKRQEDATYYQNRLSEMMPAVCPLCEQEIK